MGHFLHFGVEVGVKTPIWDFCVSDVALNDCAIYRSDSGAGASYILRMNHGRIGTLTLKNFRVTVQPHFTCPEIECLLILEAPSSIDTLIVEGGLYAGMKRFLNAPDQIAHFGGSGLVATGLWIPAKKTLPGARFLNANDRGQLYENIGGGACVKLTRRFW